jgi:hypothetical protein
MDFTYAIVDGINHIIEREGNQFTALRKVRWMNSDKEYLELRRWRDTPDGEQAAKGCTFMTAEGPSNLIDCLIDIGYGDTKEILSRLSKRDNFRKSLNSVLGKNDELYDSSVGTLEDDYHDPNDIINGCYGSNDDI